MQNNKLKNSDSKMKQEFDNSFYQENYFVDVRDISGSWVVGRIIEVNQEELILKIRIEGTKQENVLFFTL